MAHGPALRFAQAHVVKVAKVGDAVAYYNMHSAKPGPHAATVLRLTEHTWRLDLEVTRRAEDGSVRTTEENDVDHRGAAESGRLWDWS